jgi:hypothetical protein
MSCPRTVPVSVSKQNFVRALWPDGHFAVFMSRKNKTPRSPKKAGLGDTHRAETLCGQSASRLAALGHALATVPLRSARRPRRTAAYQRVRFPRFRPDNARNGGFVPASLSRLILQPSE